MWQKAQASQASTEEHVRKTKQGLYLDQKEQAARWTERFPLGELCTQKPGNGRRLARLGMKLCSCLFHRWFNLYDLGIEEDLYVPPVLRRLAGMELCRAGAPHQMASLPSRGLPGRDGFLEQDYSEALPGRESKSGIPWKSPWLYLSVLLMAWLFVL
jgi:hypothetical protein